MIWAVKPPPDFLPVLLELAASGGEAAAAEIMQEHREGIRVLASALGELRSRTPTQ